MPSMMLHKNATALWHRNGRMAIEMSAVLPDGSWIVQPRPSCRVFYYNPAPGRCKLIHPPGIHRQWHACLKPQRRHRSLPKGCCSRLRTMVCRYPVNSSVPGRSACFTNAENPRISKYATARFSKFIAILVLPPLPQKPRRQVLANKASRCCGFTARWPPKYTPITGRA